MSIVVVVGVVAVVVVVCVLLLYGFGIVVVFGREVIGIGGREMGLVLMGVIGIGQRRISQLCESDWYLCKSDGRVVGISARVMRE